MKKNKVSFYNKIIFSLLSITLLVSFFFNIDSAGSGGFIADFNNTWGYVEALSKSLFVLPSKWVVHTPLHFIILSKLYAIVENKYLIRLIFCVAAISLPYLFYLCLKIKYPYINNNILLTLGSLTFLFPSFRSGAVWANDHISALFFFLLFLIYFLKFEKEKSFKKLDANIYLQLIFLALAVYTRQYYALIYIYCMYIYLIRFNLIIFFKISLIVLTLSLPGFLLIYFDPGLLKVTFDTKLQNTILINSSILSFYLIPIFFIFFFLNKEKLLIEKKKQIFFILISLIIVLFLSIIFDYNYKQGGGYFLKLSFLSANNMILFLITSIAGITLILNLSSENKENAILLFLLIFGFSASSIFQKYYEPMFFFIFFLMIKSKIPKRLIENIKNIYYLYFYFGIYLVTAIVNDVYKITKTSL